MSIAVVHLVRAANGLGPLEAFLASYRRHDAGFDHDLILLLKGFDDPADAGPYLQRAGAAVQDVLHVDDDGLDLTAYGRAAARLPHERLCFVNSFSEILAPSWLALLDAALRDTGAALAGATGSWASHRTYERWQLGLLRRPYGRAAPGRAAARRAMHELTGTPVPRAVPAWLFGARQALANRGGTAPFPCAHVRTNAFLADRERLESLGLQDVRTKWDAYRLESGPDAITTRLAAAGSAPVVVDRHGVARGAADWPDGDVFCQADQADLLVADNQTRLYASATPHQRRVLSAITWGDRARPGR